jgi:hypothetical protein
MKPLAAVLIVFCAAGCGSNPEPGPTKKALEGTVTGVSSDHSTCFIDIGSKDGVGVGQVFLVLRDGAEIGQVSADGLDDDSTYCREIRDRRVKTIEKGDRVRARR